MDHRSAVCFAGGHPASCEFGMGGADLQRVGSTAEFDQSIFHAAAAGDFAAAGAGSGGIRIAAIGGAGAYRVFPVLAVCAAFGVCCADEVISALQGFETALEHYTQASPRRAIVANGRCSRC